MYLFSIKLILLESQHIPLLFCNNNGLSSWLLHLAKVKYNGMHAFLWSSKDIKIYRPFLLQNEAQLIYKVYELSLLRSIPTIVKRFPTLRVALNRTWEKCFGMTSENIF